MNARIKQSSGNENIIKFVADSGATQHLVYSEHYFAKLNNLNKRKRVVGANRDSNADIIIQKGGTILARSEGNNFTKLSDVLYSENLSENLFSLSRLADMNLDIKLSKKGLNVIDPRSNKIVLKGY